MAVFTPELLARLRAHVDYEITAGYTFVDLVAEGDDLVVLFRYFEDPTIYGVRASGPDVVEYFEWAFDGDLMEEIETGLVQRGPRITRDGYVELRRDSF